MIAAWHGACIGMRVCFDEEEGEMTPVRRLKCRMGQAATEYMLIVAVVVLGLVAAASHFIPAFNQAVAGLAQNVSGWLTTNQQMANPEP